MYKQFTLSLTTFFLEMIPTINKILSLGIEAFVLVIWLHGRTRTSQCNWQQNLVCI